MVENKTLALQRLAAVRSLIRQTGVIRVEQLCRQIKVSPATVRRDLDELEKAELEMLVE